MRFPLFEEYFQFRGSGLLIFEPFYTGNCRGPPKVYPMMETSGNPRQGDQVDRTRKKGTFRETITPKIRILKQANQCRLVIIIAKTFPTAYSYALSARHRGPPLQMPSVPRWKDG
jgi:hypothetical protein